MPTPRWIAKPGACGVGALPILKDPLKHQDLLPSRVAMGAYRTIEVVRPTSSPRRSSRRRSTQGVGEGVQGWEDVSSTTRW
jgi:hypothetical protein